MSLPRVSVPLLLLTAAFGMVSCGGGTSAGTSPLPSARVPGKNSSNYVTHVIVVIQENRSFDDLFATFPGANGATQGLMKTQSGSDITVQLQKVNLKEGCDFTHGYNGFLKMEDGGKMDGFGLGPGACHGHMTAAYQYVDPTQVAPYWDIAEQYVLGDNTFQTQGSGSFTAHQDLIAGATLIDAQQTKSLVDVPTSTPWGCDAPKGTKTSLLDYSGSKIHFELDRGPYPCLSYKTLRDLLDAKSVSWKYYSPAINPGEGKLWNAFDAISAVREGSEWTTNISTPETNIFGDITNKKLASVSWIVPNRQNSDHPAGPGGDTGPSWVASIVNAVGESSYYWPNTAVIVVWDDWGGFYDHVVPPFADHWGGVGFRVPMLIVSPYAREAVPSQPGYISHTQYEFGSILKFIEDTFNLGSLGNTDARANSIVDSFDFTQQPRPFQQIPSSHDKRFFLHQKPSNAPVDDQ